MKKIVLIVVAALLSANVWANSYWFAGTTNSWTGAAMTVSTYGTYEYFSIPQQSVTLQFKIQLAEGEWSGSLGRNNNNSGYAGTDVTNMNNASTAWNENKDGEGNIVNDNSCIYYIDKAFYVIVFKPNTCMNTTDDPIICASTTLPVETTFYVTGDSALVVDQGLNKSKAWNSDAIKSTANSYTLTGLKANQYYRLKVVYAGNWKGYNDLTTKAAGLQDADGGDHNIGFKLNTAGNVTVNYTSSAFTLDGDFYVKPIETKTVKLVPSDEWNVADAKFAAWTWGAAQEGTWSSFFAPISLGNDTLCATIKTSADSIAFVRFSPKAAEPTWEQQEEADKLVWGEVKDTIDWTGLTATVVGWDSLTWKTVEHPCESFGLLINGTYYEGKKNVLQTEWLEYVLRSVDLKAGDQLQVRDDCNDANWVISTYAPTSYEFTITDGKYVVGSSGTYDFYLKFIPDADEIYISKAGFYTKSVPDQCEAVMMQAFFNESYDNNAAGVGEPWNLGNTKWSTLNAQADTIGKYFDYVWLPPSANGDGMGYHPKNYGNQSSNWGSSTELQTLIASLHNAGSKVIADIVINHCQSTNGWLGFPEFDFGTYGKFTVDGSWICQNDEVNLNPAAGSDYGKATGNYDDGENWEGARDWAHDMPKVQDMFKAYLQWMRETVGYDGFRYDKGDGFNNWHHDNYNRTAGPQIAFMECYSGTDEIWGRIQGANYNLMALDFDTKWHVFNSIAGWDYSRGRGDGLLGRNNGKYAVEFIDSHDWFLRSDNDNEFGGRGNSLTENLKCRLLQANAFMLSMPGVPCVFYPHWKKYDGFIKPMIEARKLAGVHSESEVKDEYSTSTGYQATVVGKYGYLILCLGDKAHQSFEGYTCVASYYETNDCGLGKDASYQIWVNRTAPLPSGIELTPSKSSSRGEKFLKDGKLFIMYNGTMYNVQGKKVKKAKGDN